jgi:prepilin-type N-terminal cleavage/methylation domain-containing protein
MQTSFRGEVTEGKPARLRSRHRKAARGERGLTLIETLIVVALVGMLAGISFPAVTAGLDTLRLKSAADGIASLFNVSMERAQRRQQPVEVILSRAENAVWVRGIDTSFERRLDMPTGVRMIATLPRLPVDDTEGRHFMLIPGGTVPRIGVVLVNSRGAQRVVSIDPITGVVEIQIPGPGGGL